MNKIFWIVVVILFTKINNIQAQFLNYARPIIDSLTSERYAGRGYVNDGVNKAANYLAKEFDKIGLKSFDGSYFQNYKLDINTFPNVQCVIDGKTYLAGEHFLVEANSPAIKGKYTVLPFTFNNKADSLLLWEKMNAGFLPNEALFLKGVDNPKAFYKWLDTFKKMGYSVPLILKTTDKKITWSTSETVSTIPILTFPDTLLSQVDVIEINVEQQLIKDYPCKNIVGFIPGKKKNKKGYVVFTGHYDHLGMLGNKAYFPGASDNASGVSMVLAMANYFTKNKVDFPVIFILFSGEEVGLLGSEHFVKNPMFDLASVRMLINVDIMGSAEQGITVVNGEVYKKEFDLLTQINKREKYLPNVVVRGKAANSDHYFFSEAGVPSFFIYSNGGPGYYHDVWDKPNTLTYQNYDNVGKLIAQFIKEVNN